MSSFVLSSKLAVSPEAFWADQSLATVNYELEPWIHMTAPKKWLAVRPGLVSPILKRMYTLVFRQRHRRLKARYGGAGD